MVVANRKVLIPDFKKAESWIRPQVFWEFVPDVPDETECWLSVAVSDFGDRNQTTWEVWMVYNPAADQKSMSCSLYSLNQNPDICLQLPIWQKLPRLLLLSCPQNDPAKLFHVIYGLCENCVGFWVTQYIISYGVVKSLTAIWIGKW